MDAAPGSVMPSASAAEVMVDGGAHGHAVPGRAGDAGLQVGQLAVADQPGPASSQNFHWAVPLPTVWPR